MNWNAVDADRMALVFRSTATGATHERKVDWKLIGRGSGGGSNFIAPPNDLPAGKYEVFLQFWKKDRVVSRGHGFAIELTPPKTP